MLKVSLYDFDRTIYARDTGTNLYFFLFRKRPLLWLYAPLLLLFTLVHALRIISQERWKSLMLLPMTHIPLDEWKRLVEEFWKEAQKDFFFAALQSIQEDRKQGLIIGIISASLELYLEPIQELLHPDFIIGTRVYVEGGKISNRLLGENCKEDAKVRRFHALMEERYPGKAYTLSKMVSDSLHDLPLYEIAETRYTIEADGTLREGLPAGYSNDLTIK